MSMSNWPRAYVLAVLICALWAPVASAQWIETGPFTSTDTAAPQPGTLTSSTLVYGMSAQGNPVYGAANVILQNLNDPNTYWVATTSGGIWKSTDGGATWKPTTDHQPTLAFGAITIDTADPTGKTMYAASGYYSAGAVNQAPQTTILKSTDGGNSWQTITPTGIQNLYLGSGGGQFVDSSPASIKNIVAMGQVIIVAAGLSQGHDSVNQAGGLYRSTDGGQTFTLVPTFNTEITNLISATINNQTVLLAARDGFNFRPDNGIFYSNDAGATWNLLLGPGTPVRSTNSANANNLVFSGGFGGNTANMKIATGPGGSLFVAVAKAGSYQPIVVFYTPQFHPGGPTPTWYNLGEATLTSPADCPGGCGLEGNKQANLHFALVADPIKQGVAYIAGSGDFLTGASDESASIVRVDYNANSMAAVYTPVVFPALSSAPHPDTRSLVISSTGALLTTDDGGVYVLNNPGSASATWSALGGVASGGSPIRAIEAYSAVMDPKTGRLAVATQDNGASFSAPNASPGQITTGVRWQNALGGDGFSTAVNSKTSGPSILYATADDPRLARVFSDQNLSTSTPPSLLTINIAGTGGTGYQAYQNDGGANGIVVAVNAVDPTQLLFRSSRLYAWTDPGTALSGSIDINDITTGASTNLAASGTNLFDKSAWSEKIAYGTQDAPDAILAGGPLPGGGVGVYLRTQEQVNGGAVDVSSANLLASYNTVNGGNAEDPIGVLLDPSTEHKFFIVDAHKVYATNDTGNTLRILTLPTNFNNPASLGYIADGSGNANNGVRALLVGGTTLDGSQGSIISTLAPFATNVQWMTLGSSLPNAVVYGLNYYSDIDTLVAALFGRGVYVLYDVTSYYATATELWFGKANNDSAPDASRLAGNRALEKFGTGTLTLTGAPTYSGGTIIDAGTVAITADANLGAPQGGVTFKGGVLQTNAQLTSARNVTLSATGTFDAEADTTWSGAISGSGALNKIGPATLTLTGNNSYLGGSFIYGGALAVSFDGALGDPSGQIGIDTGTLRATASFTTARTVTFGVDGGTVDVGANTLTATGLWTGLGPVNKIGSGVLALEGVGFFQGVTASAGTLQVDGVLNGTSLQVASGSTLIGNGQIAAPTTVSGTLSPGAPGPGVLTFTAPLTMASGSMLRLAIDGTATGGGPGTYSQVVVNGAALSLGGTLSPFFRGIGGGATNSFTPVLGQQFIIATAASVNGTFAGVDLTSSGLPSSLRMDTVYGTTFVDLITTPLSYRIAPAGSVWSSNQQNVGAALDALRPPAGTTSSNAALQNAINTLYLLPASQLGPLLTGLSAQSEARSVANALDTLDAFATALQDHLIGGPMTAGFNNLSLSVNGAGRNFYSAYNSVESPGSAPGTGASASAASASAIEPSHWWSSVFYQNNKTSMSVGIAGGSTNITGFIAGLEGEVKPGQLVGLAASFAHTDASGTDSGSDDHYVVAAYGKRTAGPLQAAAYGGVAISSIGLRHDFQTGSGIVNQSGSATSLLAGGSIAYTFYVHGFDVSPTATASFTHLLFDGTALTSPQGFALNVPRQWTDRLRFTLGPTVTRTVMTDRGVKLTASVSGGFLYQTAPVTALDAQLFTAPVLSRTAPAGGAGGFAEVGLSASLTNWLTGFVRWHGEAREHAYSNQMSGGLSVAF